MTLEALHTTLTGLKVWKRGGQRAPHKPLLLLLAMGRAVRGESRLAPFSELEKTLTGLLRHFGPPRQASRTACGRFPAPLRCAAPGAATCTDRS